MDHPIWTLIAASHVELTEPNATQLEAQLSKEKLMKKVPFIVWQVYGVLAEQPVSLLLPNREGAVGGGGGKRTSRAGAREDAKPEKGSASLSPCKL
jgi:hypothetical protein